MLDFLSGRKREKMSDTIILTLNRFEAALWGAKMKKVRDEVAHWRDPIKRAVMLEHLDSLIAKLMPAEFDDGDVGGA